MNKDIDIAEGRRLQKEANRPVSYGDPWANRDKTIKWRNWLLHNADKLLSIVEEYQGIEKLEA